MWGEHFYALTVFVRGIEWSLSQLTSAQIETDLMRLDEMSAKDERELLQRDLLAWLYQREIAARHQREAA